MGWGRLERAWIWEVKMERNMNKTGHGNWNEIHIYGINEEMAKDSEGSMGGCKLRGAC